MNIPALNQDPVRVVIIEDEDAHFHLMQRAIRKEWSDARIVHLPDAEACLAKLDTLEADIILVDYLMPGMTGTDFLAAMMRAENDTPVIMITGQGDERIAVKAMKLGAKDYLVKSADFFSLLPVVIGKVVHEQRLKRNFRKLARINELLLESLPYPAMIINRDRAVLAANHIAREMGVREGGRCWRRFGPDVSGGNPADGEGRCPFCRIDEAVAANRAVNASDTALGGRFWDIWWIPIDQEALLTYAIDITERKTAELKINAKSMVLEGINRIFAQALGGVTEEALGQLCLSVAEESTGSKLGFIGEIGADGRFHDIAVSQTGWAACRATVTNGHRRFGRRPPPKGLYGRVLKDGIAFICNDPAGHPDSRGIPAGHPAITSFLGVPFFQNGRVTGMVAVGNRDGGYSGHEQETLESLAPAIWETIMRRRADIEHKRIGAALCESEARFRKIFENAVTGIAITDLSGRFEQCNRAYCDLTGYTEPELRRIEAADLLHPEDREANGRAIANLKAGNVPFFELEGRYLHREGQPIWVHKFVSILPGESGQPMHLMALVNDITKTKQAKAMVDELNTTLVERTQLAESRAAEIQRLALELCNAEDRERQRIAGVLHDDFQQMLAFLKFKLSTCCSGTEVTENLPFLKKLIDDGIERCRNLALELRPVSFQRTDFVEALQRVGRQMKAMHGLAVTVAADEEATVNLPTISSMLIRSVKELLLNVVKHAGTRTAHVQATTDGGYFRITVRDHGQGCDLGELREKQSSGTTFGLFDIEDRINVLGGSVNIQSAPGEGFCTTISISKDISDAAPLNPPAPSAVPVPERPSDTVDAAIVSGDAHGPIRILIADDHELMRSGLLELFQKEPDIDVVGLATDGRETIQLAAALNPDVVLMDVSMPAVSGIDATAQICRTSPRTRIIGLTMHTDPDIHRAMLNAGAHACLSKADSPARLIETVRSSL